MKILFITEIVPFPVNAGEKIRSLGLIKMFDQIAEKQIVICPISNKQVFHEFSLQENLTKTVFIDNVLEKNGKFYKLMKHFLKSNKLLQLMNRVIDEYEIDYCILDYGYQGQYIDYLRSKDVKVIYGTHNSQATLTLQMPTHGLIETFQKYVLYAFQYFHERIYFNKADLVLIVSEFDKQYHKDFVDKKKLIEIPNFLDERTYKGLKKDSKDDYIVMSASFTAYQNVVGLKWFLEYIWDEELANKIKFYIVGKGSKGILNKINLENKKNVYEIGTVDDMKPYIKNAKLSVIPLLHGSGTRLKCLEAMALETLIIGTSRGVEGINHEESIVVVDDPILFRNKILDILNNPVEVVKMEKKAYKIFTSKYSLESAIGIIKEHIK